VAGGDFGLLRAHGLDVQADEAAGFGVAAQFQHADLVEGDAQVGRAEGFVLVILQAVLVVEMDRPELAGGEGKGHFVGGIEAGEDGVGGFDQAADAVGVAAAVGHGDGVANGGEVGVVHRLVGLGLDGDLDVLVVIQDGVDGVEQVFVGVDGVLGFADVGAFAGEPEDHEVGAQGPANVHRLFRPLDGPFADSRVVGGVAAIHAAGVFPEARGE
jgi:hypothetical protein